MANTAFGLTEPEVPAGPVPMVLAAVTVKVYAAPAVGPVSGSEVAEALVEVRARPVWATPWALTGVTVHRFTTGPLSGPAVHDTVAAVSPAVAVMLMGAPGAGWGVTDTGLLGVPLPAALTARTSIW